jgi:hypothetical protein
MQKTTLEMTKKLSFVAKYGIQGEKMIIIVPKTYHKDLIKFRKPVKVTVEEMELGMGPEK